MSLTMQNLSKRSETFFQVLAITNWLYIKIQGPVIAYHLTSISQPYRVVCNLPLAPTSQKHRNTGKSMKYMIRAAASIHYPSTRILVDLNIKSNMNIGHCLNRWIAIFFFFLPF